MQKKKFLLVSPTIFNLYRLIVKNLEYLGYEVVHIEDNGYDFKYDSLGKRFNNFIRKTLFNDRSYKSKLRQEYIHKQQKNILQQYDQFDIALVIRADFFKKDLIETVRKKSLQTIGFHFDGISRDPQILEYIHFFDLFYVFDKEDITKYPNYNLLYSPNFYLDYPDLLDNSKYSEKYNVYYVSTFHESRIDDLIHIHQSLSMYFDKVKFIVFCQRNCVPSLSDYIMQKMEVRHEPVSFEEQLNFIASSDIIVDLVIADHQGYSFRIMEGIKFRKKVITTNPKVLEAEFYHPNNFFLLTSHNHDDLAKFFEAPYIPLDEDIRKRYSFTEWLNNKIKIEVS